MGEATPILGRKGELDLMGKSQLSFLMSPDIVVVVVVIDILISKV